MAPIQRLSQGLNSVLKSGKTLFGKKSVNSIAKEVAKIEGLSSTEKNKLRHNLINENNPNAVNTRAMRKKTYSLVDKADYLKDKWKGRSMQAAAHVDKMHKLEATKLDKTDPKNMTAEERRKYEKKKEARAEEANRERQEEVGGGKGKGIYDTSIGLEERKSAKTSIGQVTGGSGHQIPANDENLADNDELPTAPVVDMMID